MSNVSDKTDPRVLRTRQALQQAFADLLMATHDFDRLTVQQITEQAGVNRATFYAHYEDKYVLLNDFIREAFEARLAQDQHDDGNVVDVRLLVRVTCEFMDEHMRTCMPTTRGQQGALMMQQVQTCVRWVVLKNLSAAGVSGKEAEFAATFMSWAIFGAAVDWVQTPRRPSAEKLADSVYVLLQDGVGANRLACSGETAVQSG